jgi:alpha/beta superfamily hydrolase
MFSINAQNKSEVSIEKVTIPGAVGKLSAIIQKPRLDKNKKCPIVILAHGFNGTKEADLLKRIADTLQVHGIASVRFDFNGHGESEGEFQNMTVPNEIEDIKCVYRYITNLTYSNGNVGMAGHSQGGVVVSMAAGDLGIKISAVVLMAPAAVLRDDAIRGNTFGVQYNPIDPPEYVQLPRNLKLGRDYIKSAFSLPIYETAAKYHGPASIIHGTGDRTVPYTYGERYHDIWPGSELHILERLDHGFSSEGVKVSNLAAQYFIRFLKLTNE